MSKFDSRFDRQNASSREWLDILFPNGSCNANNNIHWVPNGPLGNSRMVSSAELRCLQNKAEQDKLNHLQLLTSYAIAYDGHPTVVDIGSLSIPLGIEAPNLLVLGASGAGKTQKITLPTALHAFRQNWSMVYINVKGRKQTRLLRLFAKKFGRESEIQLIAPLKLDRTLAYTALEGGQSLSTANEIAACLVANAARKSRDGEGAWCYNQAQEWLQHAIAAICTDLPEDRQNLIEIRQVVVGGDYQDFTDEHPSFPVLKKFARYVADGNKNAETINAAISEATAFVDEVAGFLSHQELQLESFATSGGCLIIEIDQADIKRLRPVVTLLLGRLITTLQQTANSSVSGCLPHKTVIVIDELIASGPIPGLAEALHTCREMGFCFVAGAQSISQLSTIYGFDAQTVLDGFQSQIAIAEGLDPLTADHFSRRSGMGTIALPSIDEPGDTDAGALAFSRHWQIVARPILLPSDVSNPSMHPLLGMPATILLGDGRTPPFQGYLTPCYREGAIAKMMEESQTMDDEDIRCCPLERVNPAVGGRSSPSKSRGSDSSSLPRGISNTQGWSKQKIRAKLAEVRKSLEIEATTGTALRWWQAFEDDNKTRPAMVLRLAEELAVRRATISEFFLAYVESNTNNIQANLHYLDYTRLKKVDEAKKQRPTEQVTGGYWVMITSAGTATGTTVKVVRKLTGLTPRESRKLVDSVPTPIGHFELRDDAARAVKEIEDAGGKAYIL